MATIKALIYLHHKHYSTVPERGGVHGVQGLGVIGFRVNMVQGLRFRGLGFTGFRLLEHHLKE